MSRPPNLDSDKLIVNMPARQKRKLAHNAEYAGMTVSEYVQSLLDEQPEYSAILSIDAVRDLTSPIFDEFPQIKRLWVFGSCARGTATPESDVDLAYEIDGDKFDIVRFFGRLAQLGRRVGHRFDSAHVTNPLDNEFYKNFEREKVLLHERS